MFKYLNNILDSIKNPKPPLPSGRVFNSKGQIAVVIILIVAVLFVFFAIILNLGRVSQLKNLTTIAADTSAAAMASQFASYGEMLYQVELGGDSNDGAGDDLTKCGWTGVAAIILSIIIMTVAFVTHQPTLAKFLSVLLPAVTLSLVGMALQITIVQPGLEELWNKQLEQLDIPTQFLERGIITALQSVVNDPAVIPDKYDLDMDGLFDVNNNQDYVSRFGYYYHKRLNELQPEIPFSHVLAFLRRLEQFLYKDNIQFTPTYYPIFRDIPPVVNPHTDWGFWDPVGHACWDFDTGEYFPYNHPCCDVTNPNIPPQCNVCCMPADRRPSCCDNADPAVYCGSSSICPAPPEHPFLYQASEERNPLYENDLNDFHSFLERLGHDDEDKFLRTRPEEIYPDLYYKYVDHYGHHIPQEEDLLGDFRRNDATGIYPTLWDVSRYVHLGEEQCYWCDDERIGSGGGLSSLQRCVDRFYYAEDISMPKLRLPQDCNGVDCCIYFREGGGQIRTDAVDDAPNMNVMKENPSGAMQCYDNPGATGWWKDGHEGFCSEVWPYDMNCKGKHCSTSCSAASCDSSSMACNPDDECPDNVPPDMWREDEVDEIVYASKEFIDWALGILRTDPVILARHLNAWFPTAYTWVSPTDGTLAKWRDYMRGWRYTLQAWRMQNTQNNADDMTYCYPSDDPVHGDNATISDVIGCLENYAHNLEIDLRACYDYCNDVGRDPAQLPSNCPSPPNPPMSDYGGETVACAPGSSFMTELSNRILAAPNDQEKFRFRADYLSNLDQRVADLIEQLGLVGEHGDVAQFDNFVNSEEVRILAEDYFDSVTADEQQLPGFVVYGWQSNPSEGRDEGYWHLVYVEAAAPGRCNKNCGRRINGGEFPEPGMPFVQGYRNHWYTRRCYTLFDNKDTAAGCHGPDDYKSNPSNCFTGGTVKVRVIRYDEDKDLTLNFANGVPLWRFIFHHPGRGGDQHDLITNMENNCASMEDRDASGAFMLNKLNKEEDFCWNAVVPLLERGVMSYSCAQYYFHDPYPKWDSGYGPPTIHGSINVKFIRCTDREKDRAFINRPLR